MPLPTDFRELLRSFLSHEVDFIVVGAHALAHHGHPRFTGDLDLLIRPTLANGTRAVKALVEFGFGSLGLTAEDFTQAGRIIQLGVAPFRIDLLTSISGVAFDEAWENKATGPTDGLTIHFLGRETLIRNKLATGRTQDLADVERLRRIGD